MGRALGEVMFSVDLQRELVRVTCWRAAPWVSVWVHTCTCVIYIACRCKAQDYIYFSLCSLPLVSLNSTRVPGAVSIWSSSDSHEFPGGSEWLELETSSLFKTCFHFV